MTIESGPWSDPETPDLRLVRVPVPIVHALARGETPDDRHLTPYLTGADCAGLWRMRSGQLAERPDDAPWVTRFVVVAGIAGAVGLAGFHGAPDAAGMVEVGYRIDPAHRRRGHARGALQTLLAVARRHPDVRVVRASVRPDNDASRALVERFGFVVVGEQWDDEDGREIVLEVPVGESRPDR